MFCLTQTYSLLEGTGILNSRLQFRFQHSAKLVAHSKTTVCIILYVLPGNISDLVTGVCPEKWEQDSEWLMGLGWLCWIEWIRPNSHTVQVYLERKYTKPNCRLPVTYCGVRLIPNFYARSMTVSHAPIHYGTQIQRPRTRSSRIKPNYSLWFMDLPT